MVFLGPGLCSYTLLKATICHRGYSFRIKITTHFYSLVPLPCAPPLSKRNLVFWARGSIQRSWAFSDIKSVAIECKYAPSNGEVRYKSHSRQLGWRVFVCIIYGVQNLFSLILACAHVFNTKTRQDNLCCELRKATHDSMKLQKLSTSQNPEPHGCTDSQISSGFGIFYLAELTIDRSVS